VLFHHFFSLNNDTIKVKLMNQPILYNTLYFISELNRTAVIFFFILSGFAIGLSTEKYFYKTTIGLKQYFLKRVLRILPLYFIAILFSYFIAITINQSQGRAFTINNLLGNIFFLQTPVANKSSWFIPFANNGPFWSLSYEMFFYFLFPFFLYLTHKIASKLIGNNNPIISLILAFLSSITLLIVNKYLFFTPFFSFGSLFVIWYLGYYLCITQGDKSFHPIYYLFGLVGCVFLIHFNKISDTLTEIINGVSLFFLWKLVKIYSQKFRISLNNRSKLNQVLVKIGEGSYAIYLFHFPILKLFKYYNLNFIFIVLLVILFLVLLIKFENYTVRIAKKLYKQINHKQILLLNK